ncbi:UBX/SEP domain containing protein [Cryptosporidium tyzzeri]|nr:UBX/SEP domain containing protein [Cryptosporidium tyzzeri]
MPIIKGFSDLNNNNNGDDKVTNSYTGGEKSGLAVQNPGEYNSNGRGIPENAIKVVLYKNGFIIDDEEFRDISIPENEAFIRDIKNSVAPEELRKRSKNNQTINVAVDDRSSEVYVPPKKPMEMFSGSGNSLGQTRSSALQVNIESEAQITVDKNKPTTNIQLRFHNGQKKVVTLNHDHTIADLHCIFMECAPVDGEYQLVSGFPPKEIKFDPSTTLKNAGLLQETISQNLI